MVYESDFYTTRRPYSSSRPYVSSYTVTLRSSPHMPYVAHKRLVSIIHSPVRIYHSGTYLPIKIHSRVRPSILAAELNRIRYLTRPSYKSYLEDYLQSRDYIDFDDETREIRARTDNLLRKIHVYVPRPSVSDYEETTSPERLRSDDYVRRIINSKNTRKDIESLPWYTTPEKRDIGSGNLACIKYAGGRPQSRRRPYYTVGDLIPGDVKSDVNLMSYYRKNRKAAEDACGHKTSSCDFAPAPSEHHIDIVREDRPASASTIERTRDIIQEEENIEEEPNNTTVDSESKKEEEIENKVESNNEKPIENDKDDVDGEYYENGIRKEPDDETIKKVQEYLEKKAQEKKMEEERRAWEAAERRRIQEEKELARLAAIKLEEDLRIAEIKEQERLEAERQAVIAKAEAARHEAERIIADEKLYNEAVAQAIADEEERQAKEREREEREKQTEEEDKMATLVLSTTNGIASDVLVEEQSEGDDHALHADVTDQDLEAKFVVDHDEDTQIEEDGIHQDVDVESPFVDAGTAITSEQSAEEPEPIVDIAESPKIKVRNSGEQGFDWSQYEDEQDNEESQATQIEQIAESVVDEEPSRFDEAEIESQNNEENQIFESEVNDEVAEVEEEVDHAQVEEETVEETVEFFQISDHNQTKETEDEVRETENEDEEVKSEKSSTHEVTDEEYDRENEEEEEEE